MATLPRRRNKGHPSEGPAGPALASAECAPVARPRARSQPRWWVAVGSGGARGYL